MVYAGDEGFHGGHQGVPQGAQIGGIVLAPCQPLPGFWGWWVGVVYTGDAGFHGGHNAVIQGAQIGGIVLAPCQPLPGGGGWAWYIQVMQVFMADIKV